ncbi:hypothetical protein B7P43_G17405 [Cryptotermes secundus]|uniref:Gustatory receptor n=1 Tax=Cryptotermes secundus TaxID=105785 RepID=A0A2J7QY70_9NEOP|nr:hypothetical protein B7P43_G17405 [Cryptotermes secundus]
MNEAESDIELALRPLNIVSRILGLPHFSAHRDAFTGRVKRGDSRNVVWCVVVLCTLMTGFIINIISVQFSSVSYVFEIVAFIISMPIGYFGALLAVFGGMTFSRNKFSRFIVKISEIDKGLFGPKRVRIYSKQFASCIRQLVLLLFILIPFYCCDSYVFRSEVKYVYGFMHVSSLMKEIVILQYINVVWMVTDRLQYLNRHLEKSLELPAEILSNKRMAVNTTCLSKYEHTNQICPLRFNNYKNAGMLVSDFSVRRATRSICQVENLIKLRTLYDKISEVAALINGMYGIHVLVELTYNFLNVVLSIYGVIGVLAGSLKLNPTVSSSCYIAIYVCWILVSVVSVLVISVSCHRSSAEAEKCHQKTQKLLLLEPLRQETRCQLKLLSQQLSNAKIVFTACGVFAINLSILYNFVSSAATYVIVLVQFK